jgi:Cu2+-exporting ATPase
MTSAAQAGVVIRSGRALEQLAGVDAVVFDKTGTLTEGNPAVSGVESVSSELSADEVLGLAATATSGSATRWPRPSCATPRPAV